MTDYTFQANLTTDLNIDDFGNAMENVWEKLQSNPDFKDIGFVTAGTSEAFISLASEVDLTTAEKSVIEALSGNGIKVDTLSLFTDS